MSYRPSLSKDLEEKVQNWIDSTNNGITEKNKAIEKLVQIGLNEHTTEEEVLRESLEQKNTDSVTRSEKEIREIVREELRNAFTS